MAKEEVKRKAPDKPVEVEGGRGTAVGLRRKSGHKVVIPLRYGRKRRK